MTVFNAICGEDWAMLQDRLTLMLAIANREDLGDFQAVATKSGAKLDYTRTVKTRDRVAIIPIEGPITRRMNLVSEMSGGTSVQVLATDVQVALDDPAVDALLFEVDSPGGDINGIGELADVLYAARGRKPMVGYVGHMAASGGYWLLSALSEVVIDERASVGSIGVLHITPDPSKQNSKDVQFISSQSPHKRLDPNTESGKAKIQARVDQLGDLFVQAVARNRDVSIEAVLTDFGQGGMLIGQDAVNAKMADRIGSFESTLAELAARSRNRTVPLAMRTAAHKEELMKVSDIFGGFMKAAKEQGIEIEAETAPDSVLRTAAAAPYQPDQATQDMDTQVRELRAQLTKVQAERITTDAQAFAKEQITTGHAYAAEQAHLATLYTQAAQDDASHPLAAIEGAAAAPVSRVDLLRTAVQARPANRLASSLVDGSASKATVLTNVTGATDPYADDTASIQAYGQRANGNRAKA